MSRLRASSSAAGSRRRISIGHSSQPLPPFSSLSARNRTTSSSQALFSWRNASKPSLRPAARPALEVLPRSFEQVLLEREDVGVVDVVGGKVQAAPVVLVDEPLLAQHLRAHEQDVAGEGGEALVGRIAVAGHAQRQDLPPALLGGGEEIDPGEGGRAEVADAEGAGQRRRMQEQAGGSRLRGTGVRHVHSARKRIFTTESQSTQSIAARHGGIEEKAGRGAENRRDFMSFIFRDVVVQSLVFSSRASCRAAMLCVLCDSAVKNLRSPR